MPIPTTNLLYDLKAGVGTTSSDAAGRVSAWTPQAGSVTDASVQTTAANQPRDAVDDEGNPCILFDWAFTSPQMHLNLPPPIVLQTRAYSVWVVASAHSYGAMTLLAAEGWAADLIGLDTGGGTTPPKLTANTRVGATYVPVNKGVYGCVSGSSNTVVHNAAGAESLLSAPASQATSGGGKLGGRTGATRWFSGRIYRVLIYGAQTSQEVADTKAALIAEHGIVTNYRRRLVTDGDSRTEGQKTTLSQNWTYRLGQPFLRSWEVFNLATSGDTLAGIETKRATQIDPLYSASHRSEFNVLAGTNDLASVDAATTLARLKTLSGGVKSAHAWTSVRVSTELARGSSVAPGSFNDSVSIINAAIRAGDPAWDNYNDIGRGSVIEPRLSDATNLAYYDADALHPNDGGHAVMAEFYRTAYAVPYTITGGGSSAPGVASGAYTVAPADGFPFSGYESITLTSDEASDTLTPSVGSASAGAITVTPNNGASSFTFTVTRSIDGTSTITPTNAQAWEDPAAVEYTAVSADTPPTITSASTKAGQVGVPLSYTITATGTEPITYLVSGTLPSGVTFDGANTISGTPTTSGVRVATITATNSAGEDSDTLTFTIAAAPTPGPTFGNLSLFNQLAEAVGATGGHRYNLDALNAISQQLTGSAGHTRNLAALNAIAGFYIGSTQSFTLNIDALNAITGKLGGSSNNTRTVDALAGWLGKL